jgi:hypothetical protein
MVIKGFGANLNLFDHLVFVRFSEPFDGRLAHCVAEI